jgi:type VI secretion system protein ImpG
MVDFTNLTSTTPYRRVLPTREMQWQAIQQLCSNLLGGLNLQSLHNGLRQLAVNGSPDSARLQINLKKIEAIKALDVAMSERLISSVLLRGFSLHLSIAGDHFPSKSEMKLFTTMLQQFFLSIVPMNHFCELIITDKQTGEQVQWPPMLGRQSLL